MARADVRSCDREWQKKSCIMLDAQAFLGVVTVGQPNALCALEDAKINASAAGGAAFDFDMREVGAQAVDQRIGSTGLRRIGHWQNAVMIPLDVVDIVVAQDRGHAVIKEIANRRQRHVQRLLLAAKDLIF